MTGRVVWLARDKDQKLGVYVSRPWRSGGVFYWRTEYSVDLNYPWITHENSPVKMFMVGHELFHLYIDYD